MRTDIISSGEKERGLADGPDEALREGNGRECYSLVVGGLFPGRIGGKEKQATALATHLSERNDVIVFTESYRNKVHDDVPFEVVRIGSPDVPVLRYMINVINSLRLMRRYRDRIRCQLCFGLGIDAVKCRLARRLFGIPYGISIRGSGAYSGLSFFGRRKVARMVASSEFVHLQTETLKEEFASAFPGSRPVIIPNGINDNSSMARPERERTNTIVYVGRLMRNEKIADKGVRFLIAALDLMTEPCDLIIIGDGPERAELERSCEGKNVSFLGTLPNEEVLEIMARSRITVLPSIHEGFPNVLLESISVGTPVIGTNVGGIPDIIWEGKTGHIVPVRDAKAIGERIEALLKDRSVWSQMNRNCLRAVQKYYWSGITKRFERLLFEN